MYTLFVDLDGVLVDFEKGVEAVTGSLPSGQTPRSMWSQLARTEGFYEHLEWSADGRELWDAVKHLEPIILTGLPLGSWAEPQKRAWVKRELGDHVPVITCMSRKKAVRAREAAPNDSTPILIDDREKLRDAWEQMGGIFIHHTSAEKSISELSNYMSLDG
jgi:hypothetical protein